MHEGKSISRYSKAFAGIAAVLALVNGVDFFFYGHQAYSILGACGFALMALGNAKASNGSGESESSAGRSRFGTFALIVGMLLILGSFALKWSAQD